MKAQLKAIRDTAVSSFSPHRWRYPSGSLLVLTYHRVLPRDFPELGIVEPGMFVHDDTFAMHLKFLRDEFEVVDLADWLDEARQGNPLPQRAVALTFDDGWQDNFSHAFPLLLDFQVPATIFVVTGMVGTDGQFWPERLARLLNGIQPDAAALENDAGRWLKTLAADAGIKIGRVTPTEASRAIGIAKQWTDDEVHLQLDAIEAAGYEPLAVRPDTLNWNELREMQSSGLVTVGSHTVNHVRLRLDLSNEQLDLELGESKRAIQRETGVAPSLFCYPNGDVSPAAATKVKLYYRGACSTLRGWNRPGFNPFLLRRMTMHEGSAGTRRAFAARISGMT